MQGSGYAGPQTTQPPGYGQPQGLNNPAYGGQYPPGQALPPGAQGAYTQTPGYGQPNVVVVTQTNQPGNPSTSYLCFAIFVCFCCCWPIGIAAIIFAVRVNEENARGNWAGAQSASKTALWCSVAALIAGSILYIAVIALGVTGNLITVTKTCTVNGYYVDC